MYVKVNRLEFRFMETLHNTAILRNPQICAEFLEVKPYSTLIVYVLIARFRILKYLGQVFFKRVMQFGLQKNLYWLMILLFFAEPFFSWLSKAKQRYDDLTFCTGGDSTYASVKNRRSIVKEYIVGPNNVISH